MKDLGLNVLKTVLTPAQFKRMKKEGFISIDHPSFTDDQLMILMNEGFTFREIGYPGGCYTTIYLPNKNNKL